ncbi:MAG TPA: inorganic phosphate transporter [Candidatus Sumerlaeota bacterium]|nr:inorganic phosphate transporter [Candidatus Sumerlaeota bacterium]HPS01933.1 inorganic phosphate transporter [Candidatus Sumerlaeota bacterium]
MTFLLCVVVFTVVCALVFDVINGFHDAANSIATVVSTRVLSPRIAVLWAAFFNFAAMFVFHKAEVANTISKIVRIDPSDQAFIYVVLCALLGAIVWDLLTWIWGLPTSSSHALVGGLVGAGMAHKGIEVIQVKKVLEIFAYIPLAPMIGMAIGFAIMLAVFWLFRRWRPTAVDKLFRKGQLLSAALYSLGHGGNDAQKTMGIIVAILVAGGYLDTDVRLSLGNPKTLWIILSCNIAMAIGTAFGGWRIVKTMGMKITKLKPVGGFCAETAGALTLFMATHFGIPVSTTHTITGAIIGVGATTKLSGIKWGVAQRIVWAWVFTIPFAALISAVCFWFIQFLHPAF